MTPMSYESLHFDNDDKMKTLIGGSISIGIQAYVAYMAILNSIRMLTFTDPSIFSIENAMSFEFDNEHVDLTQMSKPMFVIMNNNFEVN